MAISFCVDALKNHLSLQQALESWECPAEVQQKWTKN